MLCYGTRYQFQQPSEVLDKIIGPLLFLLPVNSRVRLVQSVPGYVDRLLENLIRSLYQMPGYDRLLVKRLLKYIALDGVSHLMMSFASICPLALSAKENSDHPVDYLVTFQEDEQFAKYAQKTGLSGEYRQRLKEVIEGTSWPAIAVSRDYLNRIVEEMDLDSERLRVVYNGIELPDRREKPSFSILKAVFPNLNGSTPIVSYVGRQDSEKGVDILLYAAKIVECRQIPMQLVICGSTAKGQCYRK